MFKIKAGVKALETRNVERDKMCEDRLDVMHRVIEKVDKVAEGVARIEGVLSTQRSE